MENIETDVVVVGYGGAGASAAISAHDHGAKVTILEKLPEGGGNTKVSGGSLALPKNQGYTEYLERLSYGMTPRDILARFVEESLKTEEWIRDLGGEMADTSYMRASLIPLTQMGWKHIPGAEHGWRRVVKGSGLGQYVPHDPPGLRLWNLLAKNVEKRGIRVLCNMPAKELMTGHGGEVVGVMAGPDGEEVSVKAWQAVILTCGGFEYNDEMKWDYLPVKPCLANGSPGNTGDGIKMAQRLGADLWHMPNLSACSAIKVPGCEAAVNIKLYSEKFIMVDKYAKRFDDESHFEIHDYGRIFSFFDGHKIEYPRLPIYLIFDEVLRCRGPLWDGVAGYNRGRYQWSLDNSEEIRKGLIAQGKDIKQVAEKIGLDGQALEDTVTKYNESCHRGYDPEFGRAKEYLGPLESPPFYATKLWPALFNTQGGPRRNREAQILHVSGKPIPRLYSAGELGSIWGLLYQGGSNNAESLAFGRIAGRNAAAEKPRNV